LEDFGAAERRLLDGRRRAHDLGATFYIARSGFELANVTLSQGRISEAGAHLDAALAAFATVGHPDLEIEALAVSARIQAMLGDADGARVRAQQTVDRRRGKRLQAASEIAWNLAAASVSLGEDDTATRFAGEAVAAAVTEALGMPADLAESYMALRWHRDALAYLWGHAPA